MKNYNIDVPVLIIFFNRPEMLQRVFNEVKKARPSKLYLYQDGPRMNKIDDSKNVETCRKIVSEIDWECEVHKKYQNINFGCDPSEFIAQKWMFKFETKGIILEDDDVPSQSFFLFCKELLDKYEFDTRIYSIAGMNHLDTYNENYSDYIFTRNQSIWGWATWRRSIELWEKEMSFIEDDYAKRILNKSLKGFNKSIEICKKHRESGKEYYESISWSAQITNNMLNIVPTRNMISNIGIGANGTHSSESLNLVPRSLRTLFYKKVNEIKFPIRHPKYILNDVIYTDKVEKILGIGKPIVNLIRNLESFILNKIFSKNNKKAN